MISINPKAIPFYQTVKPDSLHTAGVEIELARATQTLWYRNSGNRHSYYWTDDTEAPVAALTAYDTFTSFVVTNTYDSTTCELPWMCQTGVTTISIKAIFATTYTSEITCRAATNGLIAASTETFTSESLPMTNMATAPAGMWARKGYRTFEMNMDTAPDIPANRLVKIYFSAKAHSLVNNWWDLDGATIDPLLINIYLVGVFVQDKMYEVY